MSSWCSKCRREALLASLSDDQCRVRCASVCRAGTEWRTGSAGETIARFTADGDYDLVVMGTHGYGALGRLIMGSVATQVLANCMVPVLLIR